MAKKQTRTVSKKSKTGKTARTSARPLSKKTPPAKTAVRAVRSAHAKASAPKARHAATTSKTAKQPRAKATPARAARSLKTPARIRHAASTTKPAQQPHAKAKPAHATIDPKTLARIRTLLISIRDRLSGQIHSQSTDALKYVDDASSEDRTDDFDREFALNLVSSEHDVLFDVNSALRRIDDEVYGICDVCNQTIEKTRLQALPFARMCIKCQSEHERGRTRFRPFGETISQNNELTGDAEEAEAEEPA